MSKFFTVVCFVLAVCSAVAGALSLVLGHGWEQSLGFGIFTFLFFNAGEYFRNTQ